MLCYAYTLVSVFNSADARTKAMRVVMIKIKVMAKNDNDRFSDNGNSND